MRARSEGPPSAARTLWESDR